VFKRHDSRPKIGRLDKLFWVVTRRLWSLWKQALVIVTPETVVRWHRAGFSLYWNWLSHHQKAFSGKRISKELRELIFRMVAENPIWETPRIHGELLKLGFDFSERTVSRWVCRARKNPEPVKRWRAFLQNHREAFPWVKALIHEACGGCLRTPLLSAKTSSTTELKQNQRVGGSHVFV